MASVSLLLIVPSIRENAYLSMNHFRFVESISFTLSIIPIEWRNSKLRCSFSFSRFLMLSECKIIQFIFEWKPKRHWSSEAHLEELKRLGCLILHDIDVHEMGSDPILTRMKFDGIIFNFPHAGHFPDLCERHRTYKVINPYIQQTSLILAFEMFSLLEIIFFDGVNRMHKELLSYFFKNAKGLLNEDGEVHVTHREDYPYDHWKVTKLAKKEGFDLFEKLEFQKSNYPGCHNKRGGDIMSN
ncbi:hypothetical protein GIB67_025056 [Kingdonia uniflora]|uniref:25S rRNA (uridine-N(3))-methyltransferase BMT5-like domain-containing protein n=1 Tax=Kingdonia uniflora TaxID=39325 RepID=A0A7J7N817_9MAGN|nr:hypothetical protein GIB67_025056 [Kingdonia uniflora]